MESDQMNYAKLASVYDAGYRDGLGCAKADKRYTTAHAVASAREQYSDGHERKAYRAGMIAGVKSQRYSEWLVGLCQAPKQVRLVLTLRAA